MKAFILNLITTICGILLCLLAVKTGQYALAVVGGVLCSLTIVDID